MSIYTLALTAVNRYFSVVKPRRYPTLFTKKKAILSIVSVVVFTAFLGLAVTLILPINFQWYPHRLYCAHLDIISSTSSRSSGLIWLTIVGFYATFPVLVIVYCYANVFVAVRRHNNAVIPCLQSNRDSNAAGRAEEIRTSGVLFVAVVGFSICWLPAIVNAVLSYGFKIPLPQFSETIYSMSAITSAWINPLIYGVMNRAMRKEFAKLFQSLRKTASSLSFRSGIIEENEQASELKIARVEPLVSPLTADKRVTFQRCRCFSRFLACSFPLTIPEQKERLLVVYS